MSHFAPGLIRQPVTIFVSAATGTIIGNLTSGGGLAACFNGVNSEVQANCAARLAADVGYAGKDWGGGTLKSISRFVLCGPNNAGILNTRSTIIKLEGSNDGSTWTTLYTSEALPSASNTILDVSSGIVLGVGYRYHRVSTPGNGNNTLAFAEVQFYEFL